MLQVSVMKLLLPQFKTQERPEIATEHTLPTHEAFDVESAGQIEAFTRFLAAE
jgi:hypothetical protein